MRNRRCERVMSNFWYEVNMLFCKHLKKLRKMMIEEINDKFSKKDVKIIFQDDKDVNANGVENKD